MLTTIALSALFTVSAQASGAPLQDIAALDVFARPSDGELVPANARLVAIPTAGGSIGLGASLTINAGDPESLTLTERCTRNGATCLYEADLSGLTDGDSASLSLDGAVNRAFAYTVGPADDEAPVPEFDPLTPAMTVYLAPNGDIDSFSLSLDIPDVSLSGDLAMMEVQQVMVDGTRQSLDFIIFEQGRRDAYVNVTVDGLEGDACLALAIQDLAGNTTMVEGETYCRTLDAAEADDEVQLTEGATGAISLGELFLGGCNHMGTSQSAPIGIGALLFLGAFASRRRRR